MVGSIILKYIYNKTVPMGTPHSGPNILGPKPKNPNTTPYFSPSPRGSKNARHIPVGQKLREEIEFVEKSHFGPGLYPGGQVI